MLISPIMMIPEFKTEKQMQEEFLKHVDHMRSRNGPLTTNRLRKEVRIPVEKVDYVERSTLMAPPILFQTMARKTSTCPFNHSSIFVANLNNKALIDKCNEDIFDCDESIKQTNHSAIACIGEDENNASFFGIPPLEFNGNTGYADFLYAIADNSFLYRERLTKTDGFINSATREAQVMLVFFTPQSGLLTGAAIT